MMNSEFQLLSFENEVPKTENQNYFLLGIPAFNEAPNTESLLSKCNKLGFELSQLNLKLKVLLVDDCSSDDTSLVATKYLENHPEFDLIVRRHEVNKGLSGAIESIWHWGHEFPPETFFALGTLDGDDSHDPMNFVPMVQRLMRGSDVVISSRYVPGSRIFGLSLFRKILSLGMSLIFMSIGRISGVRDYSCGFRAYRSSVVHTIKNLNFKYRSFACMVELLKRCALTGATFSEVPFDLHYDQKIGASKMNFKRTIKETLRVLFDKELAN